MEGSDTGSSSGKIKLRQSIYYNRNCPVFIFLPVLAIGHIFAASTTDKLNVIIVMTDDQGWSDLGCHGHPIVRTPNLDRCTTKVYGSQIFMWIHFVPPPGGPDDGADLPKNRGNLDLWPAQPSPLGRGDHAAVF